MLILIIKKKQCILKGSLEELFNIRPAMILGSIAAEDEAYRRLQKSTS